MEIMSDPIEVSSKYYNVLGKRMRVCSTMAKMKKKMAAKLGLKSKSQGITFL